MGLNQQWMQRDLKVLWHPCTQMKDHEQLPLIPIKRGQGVWLEDFEGKHYLDAVSSWWVNVFGHANPRINQRIKDQVDQLEHVILAGFSHQPVIELSERLVQITPEGLDRVFYADNGSSCIEVALKMSFHYWLNKGQPEKKRFVTLSNSYHGETIAAMSVGDVPLFTETYKALLLDTIKVPSPDCYLRPEGMGWEEHSRTMFAAMEQTLAEHHATVAAVIVEPLIQGAGGMRMYHPVYLKLLREACDRYGVHLIHDEIAVGFGRTGTMFACEQAGIRPDFLCLSKALTGGYLPLAACLTTNEVYSAFYDDYPTLRAFLHSHSYTGNPLACAAALATLDIFEQDNVIEANKALSQRMATATAHLVDHPHVAEVRQTGMALAIEMVQDKASKTAYPWQERRGLKVFEHALSRGALLRPLGSVVYFLPPYVITPEQIDFLAEVATEGIDIATRSSISVAVPADFHPDFRDPGLTRDEARTANTFLELTHETVPLLHRRPPEPRRPRSARSPGPLHRPRAAHGRRRRRATVRRQRPGVSRPVARSRQENRPRAARRSLRRSSRLKPAGSPRPGPVPRRAHGLGHPEGHRAGCQCHYPDRQRALRSAPER